MQQGLCRYPGVAPAARREQDDCGALPGPVLSLVTVGHLLQPVALGGGQGMAHGAAQGHGRQRPISGESFGMIDTFSDLLACVSR
ncbi:hypothetical protein ACFVRU_24880 [Streptomyces sp. NPDC057927]